MRFGRPVDFSIKLSARSLYVLAAALMFIPTVAQAGFDWTPSPNQPANEAAIKEQSSDLPSNIPGDAGVAIVPPITATAPVTMEPIVPSNSSTPSVTPMQTIGGTSKASASITRDGPLIPDPDDDLAAMPIPYPAPNNNSNLNTPYWGKETNYFARKDTQPRPEPLDPAPLSSDAGPLVLSNRPELSQGTVSVIANDPQSNFAPISSSQDQAILGDQEILEGFGKDIPLALALRDIVPSKYAYAYANSSYAGLTVSWEGGKPWQEVLNDTLSSRGLAAQVSKNVVYIQPWSTPLGAGNLSPEPKTRHEAEAISGKVPTPLDIAPISQNSVIKANFKTIWTAKPGYTLREVIENWAKVANVQVEWTNPYDYPINDSFSYDGTFARAVAGLLTQYNDESPRPIGRLYPNLPKGPSILVVK